MCPALTCHETVMVGNSLMTQALCDPGHAAGIARPTMPSMRYMADCDSAHRVLLLCVISLPGDLLEQVRLAGQVLEGPELLAVVGGDVLVVTEKGVAERVLDEDDVGIVVDGKLEVNERAGECRMCAGGEPNDLDGHAGALCHLDEVIDLPGHDLGAAHLPAQHALVDDASGGSGRSRSSCRSLRDSTIVSASSGDFR